jgi:hypothetical protein
LLIIYSVKYYKFICVLFNTISLDTKKIYVLINYWHYEKKYMAFKMALVAEKEKIGVKP